MDTLGFLNEYQLGQVLYNGEIERLGVSLERLEACQEVK